MIPMKQDPKMPIFFVIDLGADIIKERNNVQ